MVYQLVCWLYFKDFFFFIFQKKYNPKLDRARRLGLEISKRDPSLNLHELYRRYEFSICWYVNLPFIMSFKKSNYYSRLLFILLYSLGLEEDKIDEDRRGIRLEAIHFRGLKDMNTKDVFEYYREFNPGDVEWIDDQSCKLFISRSFTWPL